MTTAAAAPRRKVPFAEAVRTRTLGNGARFFVLENHFNPTVAVSGSLHAGPLFAPAERRLVASLTAGELTKGTERRTKLEIAEELESRGASLSVSAGSGDPVGVDVGAGSLSRDREVLLDVLAEVLLSPVFPEEELEKERMRLVGVVREQQDQTSVRAFEAAARRIYPQGHPFHRRTAEERIAAIESLTRDELHRFYGERYGAGAMLLVVVGDVDSDEVLDGLERRFGSWKSGPSLDFARPEPVASAPGAETVRMPDKASADVVLIHPGDLERRSPEYVACILANSALGQSSLTSRLGVRVRDTEGLTYGIHSGFAATHLAGPFAVSLTVKPESRDAAVAATLEEIRRFRRDGMTPKELTDEQTSHVGRFKVDLASNGGIAHALDAAVYYGLGISYLDRYPSLVEAVTKEQADAAFAKRVNPDLFTIVSAGSFE
ncbi:MAG TPA: pitrilysin family protein [Thermoanaerobaculia bacterium]|nr:pitrilysin family protein [Thermoanaerobaculia bacterium]